MSRNRLTKKKLREAAQLAADDMLRDLPEPEEVSSFLKKFDKSDSTKANITYIANPGKENEITATIAVPPYSIVSYYSQDIPEADVFIDSECTKLANNDWDGKSDITYYVVPHKE